MVVISSFTGPYRFLSNFWKSDIPLDTVQLWTPPERGLVARGVEWAYQAAKTFDKERQLVILNADQPNKARQLGRSKKGAAQPGQEWEFGGTQMRTDWEEVKVPIMKELLQIKFGNPDLRIQLNNTGDAILIEGPIPVRGKTYAHLDTFWGAKPSHSGRWFGGQNWLGVLLMEVRAENRR